MEVIEIQRGQLRTILDRLPGGIFTVCCARRGCLNLRYLSADPFSQGSLAHVGDRSSLRTRRFIQGKGPTISLQLPGTLRTMQVQRKSNHKNTKHWQSKGGEMPFDPAEHGLYLVYGMYADKEQDFGCGRRPARNGDFARWCLICLNSTQWVRSGGVEYRVRN